MLPRKERIEKRADRKAEQLDKSGEKMDKRAFVIASDAAQPGFGGNPAAWDGRPDKAKGSGAGAGSAGAKK